MPRLTRPALAAAVFAVAVIATAGPDTRATDKKGKAAPDKAAKAETKLKEAEVLKNAYVLMAMADHDYDGHRVKAMGHAEHAQRTLDNQAAKSGTPAQKALATQQEITDARAKFLAKHQAKVHEGQAISDLQMREALQLLETVHAALTAEHQKAVRGEVHKAIQEAKTALKIR